MASGTLQATTSCLVVTYQADYETLEVGLTSPDRCLHFRDRFQEIFGFGLSNS